MENHQKWDIRVKILAFIVTCISVIIGLWTFISGQRSNIRLSFELQHKQDSIQFSRTVWEKQAEMCMELVALAARTSVSTFDVAEFKKNALQFEEKYWSCSILLFDTAVSQGLSDYHIEIKDYLAQRGTSKSAAERLELRTYNLSKACQKFLLRK